MPTLLPPDPNRVAVSAANDGPLAKGAAEANPTSAPHVAPRERPTADLWDGQKAELSKRASDLDALWQAGEYAEIVRRIAAFVKPVDPSLFASLDAARLIPWIAELYVLQQRSVALQSKLAGSTGPERLQTQEILIRVGKLMTAAFLRSVAIMQSTEQAPVTAVSLFRNTMKQPGVHTLEETQQYYLERLTEFIHKGGDMEQIQSVSLAFLEGVKSGELCEWVVRGDDTAYICRSETKPAPNHTVLSGGQDVFCAGSLRAYKDPSGKLSHVIVGTFSGHYRPDFASLAHMVRHLVSAGVPADKISVQEGEAGSARALPEIVFKFAGLEGAEAQRALHEILTTAHSWSPETLPVSKEPPQSAKPNKQDVKPVVELTGQRVIDMRVALFTLRTTVAKALEDNVILTHEAGEIVRAFDEALHTCSAAGDGKAYAQTMRLMRHLAGLPHAHLDSPARTALTDAVQRWETHTVDGANDSALGPRPPGRRTRIMATIGPKATDATLREVASAGMDIARINLARGTIEETRELIKRIRGEALAAGRQVQILIDLPGPKMRLGYFENPQKLEANDIFLKQGEQVTLTTAKVLGTNKLLPVEYPPLGKDVKVGDPIFLNDGTVELRAKSVKLEGEIAVVEAEVVQGGKVWDRKGINLPRSRLSTPTVPPEDVERLKALLPDVDLVGVSFVRSAEDVMRVKQLMVKFGKVVPVIAKIERQEGLDQLALITRAADVLMVARGDLGVEIGYENVPAAERRINEEGNLQGKPTIVATEVLQSMVYDESRPTRSDVEGVFSAVYEQGAECIMLGKETSGGQFPAAAIRAGVRIVERAESALVEAAQRYVQNHKPTPSEAKTVERIVREPVERAQKLGLVAPN